MQFDTVADADLAWDSIKAACGSISSSGLEGRYAFSRPVDKAPSKGKERAGWAVYNVEEEFARMGMGSRSKAWRFTDINADFQVRSAVPTG